jgi:acetyltransferase-like isoleucine patch superfamily enzyme
LSLRHKIRFSDSWWTKLLRRIYYLPSQFSIPAPRLIVLPIRGIYVGLRTTIHFIRRVFIAEPLFKSYCTQYGKGLKTDIFVHWIRGTGDIILGDYVEFDGKISIQFAARYSSRPRLVVGNHTGISNDCSIRIGKEIVIGNYCRIAAHVTLFDAPGHSSDPEERMMGVPAHDDQVKPIYIEDNVWIGRYCIILPGVRIGKNSIVASGSVVFADVAENSIVGGNPARKMGTIPEASNVKTAR